MSRLLLANYIDVNQFEYNETTQGCGPFNIVQQKYAYQDGNEPVGTQETIDQEADDLYTKFIGPNTANDLMGTSVKTYENMSSYVGLRIRLVASLETNLNVSKLTADTCLAWLKAGYVLSCGVYENSVIDNELNGSPYNWTPNGSHIIALCGIDESGHFLVHDTANIDKNGEVRKGPRSYANSLKFLSIFAVFLPWKEEPLPGFDPTVNQWKEVTHLPGWKDNGSDLRNPVTPYIVINWFREYLLDTANNWQHWNVPLEDQKSRSILEQSNKGLGSGIEQTFYASRLEHTDKKGTFVAWLGREVLYLENMKSPVNH